MSLSPTPSKSVRRSAKLEAVNWVKAFCSFSTRGVGRFKPEEGANPHIGSVGKLEAVDEERIEVSLDDSLVQNVTSAIKETHPYEEVALDVYNLEN